MRGQRTCSVDGCERLHKAQGLCVAHYTRWRKHGDPLIGGPVRPAQPGKGPSDCSVEGCQRKCKSRGFCAAHYFRFRVHGDPLGGGPERNTIAKSGGVCSVAGCEHAHMAHGWCGTHYDRWRRHGDPLVDVVPHGRPGCDIPGCDQPHSARGWCRIHYGHWKLNGDPLLQLKASPGQADFYLHGYHFIHVDGRIIQEHRHVMERQLGRPLLPGEEVHHKNGLKADNSPANLELWAISQPKGQRAPDLLAWAREIIARYEPVEDKL